MSTNQEQFAQPVLEVTRYDRASAIMIATVLALSVSVVWLSVVWAANRPRALSAPAPIELVDLAGGVDDGAVDETLLLESDADETPDASLAEIEAEDTEIEEMLDNVVDQAAVATTQAQRQFELSALNTGRPGSAHGTGRRALGMGNGDSGLPRDQRWFVRFSDGASVDEYARQLQFFGVEVAVLLPGQAVVLSNLTAPKPTARVEKSGREGQLHMAWQGGTLRKGDFKLCERAGIDATGGRTLHLYPKKTEALLAKLEFDYRNRKPDSIRRTYFVVRGQEGGFEFVVTRQSYFN